MKLSHDIGVCQKAAWFTLQRIREVRAADMAERQFSGPVEVDETCIGCKLKNMSRFRRKEQVGRGGARKAVVIGTKDRSTRNANGANCDIDCGQGLNLDIMLLR